MFGGKLFLQIFRYHADTCEQEGLFMSFSYPGIGKNIEVTREERQFILAICEEFAKNKGPRVNKNATAAGSSFQTALDAAEIAQKNKR